MNAPAKSARTKAPTVTALATTTTVPFLEDLLSFCSGAEVAEGADMVAGAAAESKEELKLHHSTLCTSMFTVEYETHTRNPLLLPSPTPHASQVANLSRNNSDEPAATACGGSGVLQTEEAFGIADSGGVRRDDEGEAAANRGWIEVGDRKGEESGEGRQRRGPLLPESDGVRVKRSASSGVWDGEVTGEADGVVVQMGGEDRRTGIEKTQKDDEEGRLRKNENGHVSVRFLLREVERSIKFHLIESFRVVAYEGVQMVQLGFNIQWPEKMTEKNMHANFNIIIFIFNVTRISQFLFGVMVGYCAMGD
ncbi:uncharacterized protein HKW66_Vig0169270 [Vigna angularis]|uniref:Uncharacterized protein n=1 Tax=Phaseolus angularis TaxID=3914 RepID=A0A8T0JPG6_PHAAN|nr:uncharacterized protein HKW66_Vig0169270 [Vigna angularis]